MRFLGALLLMCGLAGWAGAQDAPAIVVVDQERLFQDSEFGQRIAAELEERSAALAQENREIEAELVAEERELTERRPNLEPEEFRELADTFDEKVERLRAEQDAKAGELVALRDAERQNFSRAVGPILLSFMRESGADVMLDRRSVVVAADRVDVTDELIAEIDATVGAGGPTELAPEGPAGAAPLDVQPETGLNAGEAVGVIPETGVGTDEPVEVAPDRLDAPPTVPPEDDVAPSAEEGG